MPQGADPQVQGSGLDARDLVTIIALVVFAVACPIAGLGIGACFTPWAALGGFAFGAAFAAAFIAVGLGG